MNIVFKWWFPASVALIGFLIIWIFAPSDYDGTIAAIWFLALIPLTYFYVRWYQRNQRHKL